MYLNKLGSSSDTYLVTLTLLRHHDLEAFDIGPSTKIDLQDDATIQ